MKIYVVQYKIEGEILACNMDAFKDKNTANRLIEKFIEEYVIDSDGMRSIDEVEYFKVNEESEYWELDSDIVITLEACELNE